MSRRIVRWVGLGACSVVIAGCASQHAQVPATDGAICGELPGMSPPFVCPIGKDANLTAGRPADEGRR
ncbi:hypothetical protein [Thauera sp. SDU_THAU2]|uniref:hypothetical protein n=1 Tax=Thauera sp. SDU_THAU2 TaxID=3136633 RepID=UPI00311EC79B